MNISTGSDTDFSNEVGIGFGDKVEGAGFWIRLLARGIDVMIVQKADTKNALIK